MVSGRSAAIRGQATEVAPASPWVVVHGCRVYVWHGGLFLEIAAVHWRHILLSRKGMAEVPALQRLPSSLECANDEHSYPFRRRGHIISVMPHRQRIPGSDETL